MFKITQSSSYIWPVTVEMATDGGKFEKHTFDGEFRRLNVDELQTLSDTDDTGGSACRKILVGWKGVVDDNGEEVPFSETALEQLLKLPSVRMAIMLAFRASLQGAARKN
jgi:hypothetical protein